MNNDKPMPFVIKTMEEIDKLSGFTSEDPHRHNFYTIIWSLKAIGKDFMTSEIDFRLNAASRDTGAVDRDTHLKSADFFDIENHKQISFKGKSFKKVDDDNSFTLFGDLTIKDITKPIKLDVEFNGVMVNDTFIIIPKLTKILIH